MAATYVVHAPAKRSRLIFYILIAMAAGLAVGYLLNQRLAGQPKEAMDDALVPLTILPEIFLRLIKMIVAPLVLTTLVVGVARVGDLGAVGRIGGKTLLWFVSASLLSLLLGMILVNFFEPGAHMHLPLPTDTSGVPRTALSVKDFIAHLVPVSIIDAMAKNEILQVVVFSIFFGIAAAAIGEKADPVIRALDAIAHVILKMTGYIMNAAPFAVFGAMAAVIAKQGPGVLKSYSLFIGEFYLGLGILWAVLFTAGYLLPEGAYRN